ncbi:hypothetical protein [Streptomyces sp. NBC_01615]|uniref:hypothetical protein n=1 Tax=Streptomyces sp. NBC_01615 TaxID=2975898 RepID=UPI003868B91A
MRLRLTRQRAAPSRVRARERAEEPESGLSLGRFNLLALGAVVTIVVSIGGLVATAVGTIWSARVAADQLEQSREQAEEKQREQAARVSYWVDRGQKGEGRLYVMNRSADPVANLGITFRVVEGDTSRGPVAFKVSFPSLPPCSSVIIETKSLKYTKADSGEDRETFWLPVTEANDFDLSLKDLPDYVGFGQPAIGFQDRDGTYWARQDGGLTKDEVISIEHTPAGSGRVLGEPSVQAVKSCGDN